MPDNAEAVFQYHQRTKHQLNAYAKGPESLDWDDQPNPFRRFTGCEVVKLPPPGHELDCLFGDLDQPKQIKPQVLSLTSIGLLLELSFGLSAWKQFGPDRWALRCNPSSGNLHPTEAYVVCTDAGLLETGVYHYVSYDHHLERRCRFDSSALDSAVFIGLSSIHWREAWKYGERAFRYCQHDVGHAIAALSYAATCLGWSIELCNELSDADIAACLGLNRTDDFIEHEREHADCFFRLRSRPDENARFNLNALSQTCQSSVWLGKAERLSPKHFYRWPIIDEIAVQTGKPETSPERWQPPNLQLPAPSYNLSASHLIRQRRSAQQFNGKVDDLPISDFHRMMLSLLPCAKPPYTAWNWSSQVNMIVFVHRVAGLESGLYVLLRDADDLPELKQAFSAEFVWQKADAPYELYLLTAGNVRQAAKTLSCHQPIASDSFFSLGMLARFAENIRTEPWRYRRLFWECGLLGQILYLEAEAAGYRGTGIGCFFDDAVHGVLGLWDDKWQSLYHFTVGEALEDKRLQTFPAYLHLKV